MRVLIFSLFVFCLAGPAFADSDLVTKKSANSVLETIDKLEDVLKSKGMTIFARVDHAAGAMKVGQELGPTMLLIFGNPKIGTALMSADRKIGLALPMKALAWEDEAGAVWLAYTKPDALRARYGISGRDAVFKKMTGALDNFTNVATK